ncbi:unnamed protein product [Moneuplotes crassus]|uniref:PA14 domain-containing protein n=1 Tax=Euplotes crassus TaxID=5936 RepID=A0AAD1U8L4_EUPCR|nr:unnamed protein product [Moneuplotes crassus]
MSNQLKLLNPFQSLFKLSMLFLLLLITACQPPTKRIEVVVSKQTSIEAPKEPGLFVSRQMASEKHQNKQSPKDEKIFENSIDHKVYLNPPRSLSTTISPAEITVDSAIIISAQDTNSGQIYYVEIKNKCTRNSPNYDCNSVVYQEQVLDNDIRRRMIFNGIDAYTYSFSSPRPGNITINVYKYTSGRIWTEYYPNKAMTGVSELQEYTSTINHNWGTGNIYNSKQSYIGIKFYFLLLAPATGTFTFSGDVDDDIIFKLGNTVVSSRGCCGTFTGTISLTAGEYYQGYIEYGQTGNDALINLTWMYPGQPEEIIPSSAFFGPEYVGDQIELSILCTNGTYKIFSSGRPICQPVCGDGFKVDPEECDDDNSDDFDGCSSLCAIESMHSCAGGSPTQKDTCVQCIDGTSPNNHKSNCIASCGDGMKHSTEACEDSNIDSGDGCDSDCNPEPNYICIGGTATTFDTCSPCPQGFPPNSARTSCEPLCGDGLRVKNEECDDGNLVDGDGCNSDCQIEDEYICNGGTAQTKNSCSKCSEWYEPDQSKTSCVFVPDSYNDAESSVYTSVIFTSTIGTSFLNFLVGVSSAKYSHTMLNSVFVCQNLPLLSKLGAYLPNLVSKTISNTESMLFSFNFLNIEDTALFQDLATTYGYPMNNNKRGLEVLSNGSCLINLLCLVCMSIIILLFHLLITILKFIIPMSRTHKESCCSIFINKLFRAMTFGFYIRFIMLTYLYLCIISMWDLSGWVNLGKGKSSSHFTASLVFFFLIFILCFSLVFLILSESDEGEFKQSLQKCRACFQGLNPYKFQRLYVSLFFLKRLLVCGVIFFLKDYSLTHKLMIIISIIGLYLLVFLIQRPFLNTRDQVIEIINEGLYLVLTSVLFYFNKRKDWNGKATYLFMSVILAIFITSFAFSIANLLFSLKKRNKQHKIRIINQGIKQEVKEETKQNMFKNSQQNSIQSPVKVHSTNDIKDRMGNSSYISRTTRVGLKQSKATALSPNHHQKYHDKEIHLSSQFHWLGDQHSRLQKTKKSPQQIVL